MERTTKNVQKLVNSGSSVREIAIVFGITYTPMRMWMKRNGVVLKSNKRTWDDEQLKNSIVTAKTVADVLRDLGLTVRSSNYVAVKKHINRLQLNTSHFVGIAHGRNKKRKPLNKLLVINSNCNRGSIKRDY